MRAHSAVFGLKQVMWDTLASWHTEVGTWAFPRVQWSLGSGLVRRACWELGLVTPWSQGPCFSDPHKHKYGHSLSSVRAPELDVAGLARPQWDLMRGQQDTSALSVKHM